METTIEVTKSQLTEIFRQWYEDFLTKKESFGPIDGSKESAENAACTFMMYHSKVVN